VVEYKVNEVPIRFIPLQVHFCFCPVTSLLSNTSLALRRFSLMTLMKGWRMMETKFHPLECVVVSQTLTSKGGGLIVLKHLESIVSNLGEKVEKASILLNASLT
jgi:hypothetical protein